MVNIADLSKAELVRNNEKLVKELLIKQGYEFTKILGNRVQTKYKISKNNETHIIKIMGYRYNDKTSGNYAYVQKHDFDLQEYKFLFFVLYYGTNVYILKIPSTVFINPAPNSAFKNRDYGLVPHHSVPESPYSSSGPETVIVSISSSSIIIASGIANFFFILLYSFLC